MRPGLAALLRLPGEMADARVGVQRRQAFFIAGQRAGVEHGLRRLVVHAGGEAFEERRELRRADADDQPGIGTELAAAEHHRGTQFVGHGLAALLQRRRQQHHRVDAAHLGEHRDRLRPGGRHVAEGAATLQRTGEADRLDRGVAYQPLPYSAAVDHVEYARRHAGALGRAEDRRGDPFGGGHVSAVRLEHHRAAGGQGRGGIAAGGGERQGEVARAEHRHRAEADPALAQVDAWQRLAFGPGAVDARAMEVAAPQDFGEQAQLAAGAAAFALDARGR